MKPDTIPEFDINMIPREDRKVVERALNLFFLLFLLVGFLLGGGAAVLYYQDMSTYLNELRNTERHSLDVQVANVTNEFDHLIGDLLFLHRQNELNDYLTSRDPRLLEALQMEYLGMAATRPVYDQIRLLDENGMELVRINNRDGVARAVPAEQLQDKGDRYYFSETFALNEREIFISPLDLNMEGSEVELPPRPVLRLGTPVFDAEGRKSGIILINYDANAFFQRILQAGLTGQGLISMLNSDGYWLMAPDESREWGFMFDDRRNETFSREYPEEWKRMRIDGEGQFRSDNGLVTFKTIYPLKAAQRVSHKLHASATSTATGSEPESYFWILLSRVNQSELNDFRQALVFKLFMGGGALFVVVAIGAWYLALAISRRRLYQAQLVTMALYDPLTGLPNRKQFLTRLTTGVASARRYGHKLGLLYIDLDGFKTVNDSLGHDAGDELLVRVGGILSTIMRESDTVARLGGDEFAVILDQIPSAEDAVRVGEKIVSELCVPLELEAGTVRIGASVGVAVCPDHAETDVELVKGADQAMYQSKAKGKNTCSLASVNTSES